MRRNSRRVVLAGTLVAVILCSLASCSRSKIDQIDDAAQAGDLEKVKTLLKDNPDLVFSKKAPDLIATTARGRHCIMLRLTDKSTW